jgi:hypothetical protein
MRILKFGFAFLVLFGFWSKPVAAHEGMWLPHLLAKMNYEDMKANGLKLTAEQIYDVNNSSLKDAVVSLGGFCTAEVISKKGLLLTNHHCAYGQIANHSDAENDYLGNGFWAASFEEEKPNEGLTAAFLVRIEDVTNRVAAVLNDDMTETDRNAAIQRIAAEIQKEATEGTNYNARVAGFFHGNEFYLMVYETFKDVRLVGAPPSAIGKFGGDTDNWMWPRHTGDFSLLRIYADKDNKPAAYSADNVPYTPKHSFPISMEGVQQDDFTMVFGFPGSTDRYLTSHGVQQAIDYSNPTVVEIRDVKLKIMREAMKSDRQLAIDMATNYAQTANYWKYFIGQTQQLKSNNVYARKKALEDQFTAWVNENPARKEKYGEALPMLEKYYQESDSRASGTMYLREAGLIGAKYPIFGFQIKRLLESIVDADEQHKSDLKSEKDKERKAKITEKYKERREAIVASVNELVADHFDELHVPTDQKLVGALFQMYHDNADASFHPAFFAEVNKRFKGDFNKFAAYVYSGSLAGNRELIEKFVNKPSRKALDKDFGLKAANDILNLWINRDNDFKEQNAMKARGYRLFTAGLREMLPNHKFAPDANSTLRLTWGTVGDYHPKDAVLYDFVTTTKGILEKEDPNNDEFIVPEKLKTLIQNRDFGRYADENGELIVNFISNNDITGGNSGSPVLNAKGHLIGCAFDGNWEAMSGDIFFETELQRTISVDARYIVFIMDKYAGAQNLVDELELVFAEKE